MKKSLAVMLALIMVLCMIPTTALAANMSWTWTVTIFGGNYYRANGTETTTNKYTINRHLDNSVEHEIGYKFEWNASAGGNNYNGGWQLCLTVDGKIVDRSTAYIYERDMSNASGTWTAPASSHTGNSSHPFTLYLSNYPVRFQNITLTYDANGGTNAPASETKRVEKGQSATFTVSTQEPTRENYTFKGWSTNKNATTAEFIGGNSITISQNTTLYAVWEENYTPNPSAPPAKPDDYGTLKNLLGNIKVTCVTLNVEHGTKEFDLIDGSYTVGAVEGDATSGYTCKVSIFPDKYVDAYNNLINGHTVTEATAKIVTLKSNNDSAWLVDRGTPVEFNVQCETEQPTAPAKPIDNDVLGIEDEAVKVHCINDDSSSDDQSYGILPDSFSIGDVILKDGVYTCDITVYPELYVDKYVEDLKIPHTLSPAGQTGTITLIYYAENQVWDLMPNYELPIVFNVKCSDEDETFTVTYFDGFSGTYATYPNLKYGDATPVPANPYRSGYIFLGWQPSVAPTVTSDARYVAQWGYIGPQYPNPTPVQPVQPGILPPQTGDMPLWYAIARFLGLVK